MDGGAWWAAVHGVAKSQTRLSDFSFTFHFHALEKEMATHSSVLACRMPGTAEPGGLPSMGSHRVGHDWSDLAAVAAAAPHILVNLWLNFCLFGYFWNLQKDIVSFSQFPFYITLFRSSICTFYSKKCPIFLWFYQMEECFWVLIYMNDGYNRADFYTCFTL